MAIPSLPLIRFRIPKSDSEGRGLAFAVVRFRIAQAPNSSASSRARRSTVSSIRGVSTPVNVFCWLGWYVPTSRYGPTAASAPCPNAWLRPDDVALGGEQPEPGIPRVRPERHDDPDPGQQPELEREPWRARVALLDRRLVGGRGAAHRRCDVGVEQRQAVVGAPADRPVGEPDRMERSEEEVARRIAREDPTGPVAAVRRGREAEQQDARVGVTEAGHGTRPVGLVAEAGDLLACHPLAPLDQPRAAAALHDLGGQRREGCPVGRCHAISAGACRAAGS